MQKPVYKKLIDRLKEPRKFIQVLLGPRQVGKTTLTFQIEEKLGIKTHYITADTATLEDLAWLETEWQQARDQIGENGLLIIDEAQKIPHWSSLVKKLWDEDTKSNLGLKVLLLGSSPWLMQKGLSESLAGRFEILPVTHWTFDEMRNVFGWDLDQFLFFGGYPGPANLADKDDISRWRNYINDALIETALSRDILLMAQVNKPALLRRLFQLGCIYSGQMLSYQKMVGQLADAGNTTTLAHYLGLLEGAGLLCGIPKYANQPARAKGSSPKLQVFNTALLSAQSGKSFHEAKEDKVYWGRLVESAIGAYLLNGTRGAQVELYYWREGNKEVDFVLKKGRDLIAIEVKSGNNIGSVSGLDAFKKAFNPKKLLVVGNNHGMALEQFLKTPLLDLFL